MSKKKKGAKKFFHPEQEQVAGTIASYDQGSRIGTLNIGDGETATFKHRTFVLAGHPKIKIGAQVNCTIVPSQGGKAVAGIHEYIRG